MSIIARIFVLIAVTLSLVAGGALFNGLHLLEKRSEELRSDTIQLARIAELDMVRILDGTHQLLATLAKLPLVHSWDERACAVLAAAASSDFEYDHLVAVDRGGIIRCSSNGPTFVGTAMPDSDLFRRVVATKGFSVGSYGVGRLSSNEVIRAGFPVVDDGGTVVGAVYAGINLTWLNTAIGQWKLGETATIDITDRNGILVARHPEPSRVGSPLAPGLRPFLSAQEMGTAEVDDHGVVRLYGYVPVAVGSSDGLAVFVGRSRAQAFADINRSIWVNAAVVLGALLLSALFAVFYVRRFLTRPFESLLIVAGRWREGDWSARSGAESGIPELDRLALAFNEMAAAVDDRDQSLHYRDALLAVITKSAAELVTAGTIAVAIPRILQGVGEALGVDRVLVLQNHATGPPLTLRNAWQRPGATVEIRPDYFSSLPAILPPEVRDWLKPLHAGNLVAVTRRDVSGAAREMFDELEIVSNLQAPVVIEGALFAQLAIDDCRTERSWTPVEREAVTTLADLIGAAISREDHLEKLSNADSAVRRSPAVLYRFSTETVPPRLIYVSDNVTMFGSTAAELIADPQLYLSRIHPDDRHLVGAAFIAAQNGEGTTIEFRVVDPRGTCRWLEGRYAPKRNASGGVVEVSGVVIDVTERKAADEKLQFANTLLLTLREASPDAILAVAADKTVSTFNQRFLDLWQLKPELLGMGTDDAALAAAAPLMKEPERFEARIRNLYEHPDEAAREDVETADGRYLEQTTSPLRTAEGRYIGRVWFYRDVTERRRAVELTQATLTRAREQLRVIGDLSKVDAFLSGDVESLARQVTEQAAKVIGCERANVWRFNEDETQLICIDLYETSSGIHSEGMVLNEREYRHEFQALKEATHVAADDALTDPRTAGYVASYLKPLRITSMLDSVIRVGGRNLGLLCFEHVSKPHRWVQDEIAFALQLADKIGIGFVNQQRRIEEEKRRISEADLAEAQEIAHLGSWSYDHVNDVATYSKESYRILGVDPKSFGRSYREYLARIHPDDRRTFERAFADGSAKQGGYSCDYRLVMDDEIVKWIHDVGRNSYDCEGRRVRTFGTMQDISERKKAEELIAQMAHFDHLTGLANRRAFVEALDREISRVERDGRTFAVLYLDLDHFKDINDTLGHPIGDLLLQSVAERLQQATRLTDTVARFGGDEFAMIDTNITEPADAAILAERVQAIISAPFLVEGNEIRSGASIGIAVFGAQSHGAEMLLSHADLALYRAKADGRGTYRFFTAAMDAEARTRVTLGAQLRKSIVSEQLFLLYQPQVDADTARVVGLEALVRWRHPDRGLVSPAEFIPIAERTGMIVALGNWVMREACRQTRKWLDAGLAPPLIAVNLSALQFKAPMELEKSLASALAESTLPSRLVELELTESVLMEASGGHNDVLRRLRKSGFRIAIDDFGTGYSSLDYLRRFPVDRIKIAQNFIFGMMESSDNQIIVKAAIGLARELNLDVVVEGVETAEQLKLLRSWGCRTIQGYYFSKPLPASEITALLRSGGTIRPHIVATADLAVGS